MGIKAGLSWKIETNKLGCEFYAVILQCVCQLAIEAIAKRANTPQILKSDFERMKLGRSRAYAKKVSFEAKENRYEVPLGNLFYPCSGVDTYVPLKLFLNSRIQSFYFADIGYKNDRRGLPFEAELMRSCQTNTFLESGTMNRGQFRQSAALIGKDVVTEIQKRHSQILRRDYFSLQTDFGEVKIPHPRYNEYELTLANSEKKCIQIYRSDAFSAFQSIHNIAVFFFRLDGTGEGGSNQLWLNNSLFPSVLEKMVDGGLVITDGGNGSMAKDLKLKSEESSFEYNGITFVLLAKIDEVTRVWKIEK